MGYSLLEDVTTLNYTVDKCTGCGRCCEVCPHGVFVLIEKKAVVTDKNFCMECGACALNCPAGAISVNAGVGCAAAFITGWLTGGEPACDGDGCC
ncbi:MAG: 4Fe-4S binding protein [Oscillospiraceae bacterium]|nr:4Fe-4S binding protein [Oscillospiraceae bacterium]